MESITSEIFDLWGWSFFSEWAKFSLDFKNAKESSENFFVLEILAFEGVLATYLYYEVNSCDRQSRSYQAVLRSQILLGEMFSNWIFFWSTVKLQKKCGHEEFIGVWEASTRWFTKILLKRELSGIQTTTFFGVNSWKNLWATKLAFFFKMHKILFKFQKCNKKFRKFFSFWR